MKLLVSCSLLLVFWFVAGCSGPRSVTRSSPASVRADLVDSFSSEEPRQLVLPGTVGARQVARISAQVPGRIRSVLVHAGDRVRAGELLVVLDSAAQKSNLARAVAAEQAAGQQRQLAVSQAQLAASTLARYRILQREKSVSPQEFDEVERRTQSARISVRVLDAESAEARAAVVSARAMLGYMELHAPFPGIVTARLADPGTMAEPGMPILNIDQAGPLEVDVQVDESLIRFVHDGMSIPIQIGNGVAGEVRGEVSQLVPSAAPTSRTFLLKIKLPTEPDVFAGMYATVRIPGEKRTVVLAPESAVVKRGSLNFVYVVGGDAVARLRYVTLGRTYGKDVVALSGLMAGEQLVDHPGDRDWAGTRVDKQQVRR